MKSKLKIEEKVLNLRLKNYNVFQEFKKQEVKIKIEEHSCWKQKLKH